MPDEDDDDLGFPGPPPWEEESWDREPSANRAASTRDDFSAFSLNDRSSAQSDSNLSGNFDQGSISLSCGPSLGARQQALGDIAIAVMDAYRWTPQAFDSLEPLSMHSAPDDYKLNNLMYDLNMVATGKADIVTPSEWATDKAREIAEKTFGAALFALASVSGAGELEVIANLLESWELGGKTFDTVKTANDIATIYDTLSDRKATTYRICSGVYSWIGGGRASVFDFPTPTPGPTPDMVRVPSVYLK